MISLRIETHHKDEMLDITAQVERAVEQQGVAEGLCTVYCPHTTAAITINENADPDVVGDLLFALDKTFPDSPEFRHMEGNSAAHLKSSVVGAAVTLPIHGGKLFRGRWQGIWFCEFDGPRSRQYCIQIAGAGT